VQVYAASQGRHFVVPSDVQRLAGPVLAHRLVLTREALLAGTTTDEVLAEVVERVPVPRPQGQ
jgi:MoxR-like ATPase